MHISLINPNSTASMTEKLANAAQRAAAAGTEVSARQPAKSPPAIEGVLDGAMAVPLMLEEMAKVDASVDAHIIACFDDTGLDAARALFDKPVIGIGEASMTLATLVARRFCVVTTLSRSVPILEDNLDKYGLSRRCTRVYASDIPVLELEHLSGDALSRLYGLAEKGIEEGAEAIVLGCAGMADLARGMQEKLGVPVIEGIGAAVKLSETLVTSGLSSSKRGIWTQQDIRTGSAA